MERKDVEQDAGNPADGQPGSVARLDIRAISQGPVIGVTSEARAAQSDGVPPVSNVIDLYSRRPATATAQLLSHPAGVTLPLDTPSDAALIVPELRGQILSGAYSAELAQAISSLGLPGARALVIGAGLGVASSLVAKVRGVKRVIAIEANAELLPYLKRVHELNEVPFVETVHAVLGAGRRGMVPFYSRPDIRTSSTVPDECSWQLSTMVPSMDVNLILSEERISLIVCDVPDAAAQLAACTELATVDSILVGGCGGRLGRAEADAAAEVLAGHGFAPVKAGGALVLARPEAAETEFLSAKSSA